MYCHSWLGIVPPPPPVDGWTTSITNLDPVGWPCWSDAFSRITDPAQESAGYGLFTQTFPPSVKIPSRATRSGNTPSSRICKGISQTTPDPDHAGIVAYTEAGSRHVSGSQTLRKR